MEEENEKSLKIKYKSTLKHGTSIDNISILTENSNHDKTRIICFETKIQF